MKYLVLLGWVKLVMMDQILRLGLTPGHLIYHYIYEHCTLTVDVL